MHEFPAPVPIELRTLPRWIRRTVRVDRRLYRHVSRPLTPSRIAASLWPRLGAPIFVVGAPRSGTTFLGECLGAAPEISYHHEPVATKAAARYVYDGLWGDRRLQFFYRCVYRWLQRIHLDGDLQLAEKTPRNALIVDFLARTFPRARFVHIIRDGRDAALSYSKRPWLQAEWAGSGKRGPGGYPYGPFPRFWVEPERRHEFASTSNLHRCVWGWRRHAEAGLASGRALPSERYCELRYEDLVSSPAAEGERILDFLQIESAESRDAVLGALGRAHASSVGSWRSELGSEELRVIWDEAGDLLERLGYGP